MDIRFKDVAMVVGMKADGSGLSITALTLNSEDAQYAEAVEAGVHKLLESKDLTQVLPIMVIRGFLPPNALMEYYKGEVGMDAILGYSSKVEEDIAEAGGLIMPEQMDLFENPVTFPETEPTNCGPSEIN